MHKAFCLTLALLLSPSLHAAVYHVDASRPDDSGDGATWASAKKSIQAAVALTAAGDTVLVTNGVYSTGAAVTPGNALSNRVAITNAITVRSVNGADLTVIEGSGTNHFGTASALRCVFMSRGTLDGFTLRYGATLSQELSESPLGHAGGGVNMGSANSPARLLNCIIRNCRADSGGGAYGATLEDCRVTDNQATYNGGGAYESALTRCTLSYNSAPYGGGAFNAALQACLLDANAAAMGGGSFQGHLSNCLLLGNSAQNVGGGSEGGALVNCTLVGNTAFVSGSGAWDGALTNCVVWENYRPDGTLDNYEFAAFAYSCASPLPPGVGNTASDPMLVDARDVRLRNGSPCLNAGTNAAVAWPGDFDGAPRIQGGTVDMGAFEGSVEAVAQPAFDPPSGTPFTHSLTVTVTCATEGATLRYTLDGSEPDQASAAYGEPLLLTETTTVTAKAFKDGLVAALATARYTQRVATPVFAPASGAVATNALAVTLTCDTPDAVIRYTADGSEPSPASAEYTNALTLTHSATVKAKAYKAGQESSATATADYTVIPAAAPPVFSPASGALATNSLAVTLTCDTPDAVIRYTVDGSDPSASSAVYQAGSPLVLTHSATVKARAYKDGMADSAVAAAVYTVVETVQAPVLTPDDGTVFYTSRKVTLSCATAGAAIRYTTNGSAPAAESPLYTRAFNLFQTTTVRARAFKAGLLDSPAVSATYYKLPPLSDALDATNLLVQTGGDAYWFLQAAATHDGADAAQSGAIADSQATWMETAVAGPGTLTFWWKSSCEDDPDADNWDYVAFSVDGVEQGRLDGVTGWQPVTCTLSNGTHTLRWEYRKDDTVSEGDDCAWVDQLRLVPGDNSSTLTTPVPVPYLWLDSFPGLVVGGDYETAANGDQDNDRLFTWQEYVAGTVPTNAASVFLATIQGAAPSPLIGWSPDLTPQRVYAVEGKSQLADTSWAATNAASRFFRVRVDLPE